MDYKRRGYENRFNSIHQQCKLNGVAGSPKIIFILLYFGGYEHKESKQKEITFSIESYFFGNNNFMLLVIL